MVEADANDYLRAVQGCHSRSLFVNSERNAFVRFARRLMTAGLDHNASPERYRAAFSFCDEGRRGLAIRSTVLNNPPRCWYQS
jgi:hypothetical protein